jgi:hypothetical protein
MDKSNVLKTSDFYMNEGDILHVLIKDFAGTPIALRLSESDNGVIEDGDVITDESRVVVTVTQAAYYAGSLTIVVNSAVAYVDTNLLFLNIKVTDTWTYPDYNRGWALKGMYLLITDAGDNDIVGGGIYLPASSNVPYTYVGQIELTRNVVALDEITVTIDPAR